jgi:hypothetical protein
MTDKRTKARARKGTDLFPDGSDQVGVYPPKAGGGWRIELWVIWILILFRVSDFDIRALQKYLSYE